MFSCIVPIRDMLGMRSFVRMGVRFEGEMGVMGVRFWACDGIDGLGNI